MNKDKQMIERLKNMCQELHWMARRYADGRRSYATCLFNDLTRILLHQGIDLNPTADGTIWARDGMGREFDKLTDEEAAMGKEPIRAVTGVCANADAVLRIGDAHSMETDGNTPLSPETTKMLEQGIEDIRAGRSRYVELDDLFDPAQEMEDRLHRSMKLMAIDIAKTGCPADMISVEECPVVCDDDIAAECWYQYYLRKAGEEEEL